jgi:hypothetical protein
MLCYRRFWARLFLVVTEGLPFSPHPPLPQCATCPAGPIFHDLITLMIFGVLTYFTVYSTLFPSHRNPLKSCQRSTQLKLG